MTQQWLDRRGQGSPHCGQGSREEKGIPGLQFKCRRPGCAQRRGDDGGRLWRGKLAGGGQGPEGPIHPAAQVTRGNCYLLGFSLWGYFLEGLAKGKALPKWGPSYNEISEKNTLPATSISSLLLLHILKLPPAFTEDSSCSPPTEGRPVVLQESLEPSVPYWDYCGNQLHGPSSYWGLWLPSAIGHCWTPSTLTHCITQSNKSLSNIHSMGSVPPREPRHTENGDQEEKIWKEAHFTGFGTWEGLGRWRRVSVRSTGKQRHKIPGRAPVQLAEGWPLGLKSMHYLLLNFLWNMNGK